MMSSCSFASGDGSMKQCRAEARLHTSACCWSKTASDLRGPACLGLYQGTTFEQTCVSPAIREAAKAEQQQLP